MKSMDAAVPAAGAGSPSHSKRASTSPSPRRPDAAASPSLMLRPEAACTSTVTPTAAMLPSSEVASPPYEYERLLLYMVLEFNSGLIESFSYTYLGSVFCAFVTGTMIILGLQLASPTSDIFAPLIAVGAFCLGSWLAGRIRERTTDPSDVLRRTRRLLVAELLFLVPAAIVAGRVQLTTRVGQYVSITLTALAMSLQMAASMSLAVRGLPTPVATTAMHKLFIDNPFTSGHRRQSLRPLTQLAMLIVGAVAGSGLGRKADPWVIVLVGCVIVVIVLAGLEALCRRETFYLTGVGGNHTAPSLPMR